MHIWRARYLQTPCSRTMDWISMAEHLHPSCNKCTDRKHAATGIWTVETCSLEWHSTILCLAVQWMSLLNHMESISGRVRTIIHEHQTVGLNGSLQIKSGIPIKVMFMYVSILLYFCIPHHVWNKLWNKSRIVTKETLTCSVFFCRTRPQCPLYNVREIWYHNPEKPQDFITKFWEDSFSEDGALALWWAWQSPSLMGYLTFLWRRRCRHTCINSILQFSHKSLECIWLLECQRTFVLFWSLQGVGLYNETWKQISHYKLWVHLLILAFTVTLSEFNCAGPISLGNKSEACLEVVVCEQKEEMKLHTEQWPDFSPYIFFFNYQDFLMWLSLVWTVIEGLWKVPVIKGCRATNHIPL